MSDKTRDSKQVPIDVVRVVIADLRAKMEAGEAGFQNYTAIGSTLGVAQPSVSAWFGRDPGMSRATLDKIEAKLGKDYLGRRLDSAEAREWSMRWRALLELEADGKHDLAKAFQAVRSHQLDHSKGPPSWGDVYSSVRSSLDEKLPKIVGAVDIPRAKGPPKKRNR